MSVHGEQSNSGELREQSEFLQSELTRLSEQLKSQTDDAEKERLEMLIGDIHASIEIQKVTMEPTSVTSECAKLRQSSRERTLTPKMLELKQKEVSQLESKFNMQYTHWKDRVRDTRTKLKDECSDNDLSDMMDTVEEQETRVKDVYDKLRFISAPSINIRRNIDSCIAVTADLMGLMKVRMSEVGQEEFDGKAENARLHMVLDRDYTVNI